MNETLVKNIVKYKLNAAEKLLDCLPSEISNSLKDLGRLMLKSINENSQELKEQPINKTKPGGRLILK